MVSSLQQVAHPPLMPLLPGMREPPAHEEALSVRGTHPIKGSRSLGPLEVVAFPGRLKLLLQPIINLVTLPSAM